MAKGASDHFELNSYTYKKRQKEKEQRQKEQQQKEQQQTRSDEAYAGKYSLKNITGDKRLKKGNHVELSPSLSKNHMCDQMEHVTASNSITMISAKDCLRTS